MKKTTIVLALVMMILPFSIASEEFANEATEIALKSETAVSEDSSVKIAEENDIQNSPTPDGSTPEKLTDFVSPNSEIKDIRASPKEKKLTLEKKGDKADSESRIETANECKGDINRDGKINNFDIDPFKKALKNGRYTWRIDMNNDRKLSKDDSDLFVKLLTGEGKSECRQVIRVQDCKGDINRDGRINNFDIDPFRKLLEDERHVWRGDFNNDNLVTEADADLFTEVLLGKHMPECKWVYTEA